MSGLTPLQFVCPKCQTVCVHEIDYSGPDVPLLACAACGAQNYRVEYTGGEENK